MLARARLVVECDHDGRSVVRALRSQPPLCLLPQRGTAAARSPVVTVRMVSSATTPLGGDDVELDVVVGPGAQVVLTGVAAALALPAQGAGASSRLVVRLQVGDGASLQYLPEAMVITRRADHASELRATLGTGARLRCRELLVAGRSAEPSGRYRGLTRVTDGAAGRPLLVQCQELGDARLHASPAHLAGRRVLGTEVLVWDEDPADAVAGQWWSLTLLAGRGALATAVAADAVTVQRDLATAVAAHPGWSSGIPGAGSAGR
ncbi:MAG: urease accessory protein UreD [Pseudonocardia sp.]